MLSILGEMQQDVNRTAQVASRFETIGSLPRLQPGEVSHVARETVDYFRRRWSRLGTQIEVREHYARTPSVYLNRDLLQWVFENLLRNAMDALEAGGTIEITTAYRPEDGSVEVRFSDSGRGMTPQELRRAFEPGFTTKSRGWGLGLALAKRIIEEYHGGRIWARSAGPGKGTTFHITFPV
jgi:signal transduction histidine kinase